MTASLKCTRCLTGSQWSCFKTDVMCSCRHTPVIKRAAAFWTACTRRNKLSVMPYRSELQWSRQLEINAWTRVLVASVDNDLTTGRNYQSWTNPERQTALTCADMVSSESRTTPRSRAVSTVETSLLFVCYSLCSFLAISGEQRLPIQYNTILF